MIQAEFDALMAEWLAQNGGTYTSAFTGPEIDETLAAADEHIDDNTIHLPETGLEDQVPVRQSDGSVAWEGKVSTEPYDGAGIDVDFGTGGSGAQGPPGADGLAATIAVGTTTTGEPGTNASVINSGTESVAVLDFTIPRGATGQPGTVGANGERGLDGTSVSAIEAPDEATALSLSAANPNNVYFVV